MLKFHIVFSLCLEKGKIGTWIKQMNEWSKWVEDMKWRGQKEHSKQGDKQNKFIYCNKTCIDTLKYCYGSINKIVMCVYVCVCVCV